MSEFCLGHIPVKTPVQHSVVDIMHATKFSCIRLKSEVRAEANWIIISKCIVFKVMNLNEIS